MHDPAQDKTIQNWYGIEPNMGMGREVTDRVPALRSFTPQIKERFTSVTPLRTVSF